MVMDFFGIHISKCNRLSKNTRPIQAIEVLYRLRNKQKHYIIYSETPCSNSKYNLTKQVKVCPELCLSLFFWVNYFVFPPLTHTHDYVYETFTKLDQNMSNSTKTIVKTQPNLNTLKSTKTVVEYNMNMYLHSATHSGNLPPVLER